MIIYPINRKPVISFFFQTIPDIFPSTFTDSSLT